VPEWVTGQGWDGYSAGRSTRVREVLSARTIGGSAVRMPTPIANANHEMDVDTDNNKTEQLAKGTLAVSGPTSTRTYRTTRDEGLARVEICSCTATALDDPNMGGGLRKGDDSRTGRPWEPWHAWVEGP
jgi:hypothetical protein